MAFFNVLRSFTPCWKGESFYLEQEINWDGIHLSEISWVKEWSTWDKGHWSSREFYLYCIHERYHQEKLPLILEGVSYTDYFGS